jgi:hypothetical protein
VEALQHGQHRAVFVIEQSSGDMHAKVRCNADKILVEGAMMN